MLFVTADRRPWVPHGLDDDDGAIPKTGPTHPIVLVHCE
jgi:hypothetical protein